MIGESFWTEYGPNRFETMLLGGAVGLAVASRVGVTIVAAVAVGIAVVSYITRRYLKV